MSLSNTLTFTLRTPDAGTLSKAVTVTDEGSNNASLEIAGGATANITGLDLDVDKLEMFWFMSTKDAVLETNSASEADDTINLKANCPAVWYRDSGLPCPLTGAAEGGAITSIHVTNSDAEVAATFELRTLSDVTA